MLVVMVVKCLQMVNIVVMTKLVETTRTYLQQQSRPPKSRQNLEAQREQNSDEEPLLHEQLQVRTPLSSPRC